MGPLDRGLYIVESEISVLLMSMKGLFTLCINDK